MTDTRLTYASPIIDTDGQHQGVAAPDIDEACDWRWRQAPRLAASGKACMYVSLGQCASLAKTTLETYLARSSRKKDR
jgi:hypothetical protein